MDTKGLLFGSIGLQRAWHVFLTVGIIDLLISIAVWRGWSILQGNASNNAPLSQRGLREVARNFAREKRAKQNSKKWRDKNHLLRL